MPWPKLAHGPVSCVQLSWLCVAEWIKAGRCIHPVLLSLSFLLLQRSHVIAAEVLSPPQNVKSSLRFLALLLSVLLSVLSERGVLQLDLAKLIFWMLAILLWFETGIKFLWCSVFLEFEWRQESLRFVFEGFRIPPPPFFFPDDNKQSRYLGWDLSSHVSTAAWKYSSLLCINTTVTCILRVECEGCQCDKSLSLYLLVSTFF